MIFLTEFVLPLIGFGAAYAAGWYSRDYIIAGWAWLKSRIN